MTHFHIADAAALLGVSDDTVRRHIALGRLSTAQVESRASAVDGVELAAFIRRTTQRPPDPSSVRRSARNQLVGLVIAVRVDGVMAQVEMQCGPQRVVSLMSADSVAELELEPGVLAVAVVKSSDVIVEVPVGTARG